MKRKVLQNSFTQNYFNFSWEYRRVYGRADQHFRGIFEWGLLYKETEIPAREISERKHGSEPFR